jgi:hypothetical protein
MSGVELFGGALTLGDVAAGLGAVGTVASIGGQLASGAQQQAAAAHNARVAKAEAESTRAAADYEATQYQDKARRLIATQRAEAAASGLGLEGSVFDVMDETASQAAYDALLIRHAGDVKASQGMSEAALSRLQGKFARSDSYYGGTSTFLTGASRLAEIYK